MDKSLTKQENNFLGSGWAFPVSFSNGTGELKVTQYEKNVEDNIDVILMTKRGERILESNYGAGLQQFMFRNMDESLKGEMIEAIKMGLLLNEPRINVLSVDVEFQDIQNGKVVIFIQYEYNQTNTRHNYVFPFSIKEGTSLKTTGNN